MTLSESYSKICFSLNIEKCEFEERLAQIPRLELETSVEPINLGKSLINGIIDDYKKKREGSVESIYQALKTMHFERFSANMTTEHPSPNALHDHAKKIATLYAEDVICGLHGISASQLAQEVTL